MATARKKEKKGQKCGASRGQITNLKESIFFSLNVYGANIKTCPGTFYSYKLMTLMTCLAKSLLGA
jgi:hypothetical protein